MTLRVHHQIILLPKFAMGQFDRLTRMVYDSRVAEVDSANPPIALDAARIVFNLDRNNLAASLLPEFCEGETFKVMLRDAMLGHHSTPMEPAPSLNSPETLLNIFRSFVGTPTVAARLSGNESQKIKIRHSQRVDGMSALSLGPSAPSMTQVLIRDSDRFGSVLASAHLRLGNGFNECSMLDEGSDALIPVQRFQSLFRGKRLGLDPATLRNSTGLDQKIEVAVNRILFAHAWPTRRFYARSVGRGGAVDRHIRRPPLKREFESFGTAKTLSAERAASNAGTYR
jgi:hypothetical protein